MHQEVLGEANRQGRLGKDLLQHAEEHRERSHFLESLMVTILVEYVCEMEGKVGTHVHQRLVLVLGHPGQAWRSCRVGRLDHRGLHGAMQRNQSSSERRPIPLSYVILTASAGGVSL